MSPILTNELQYSVFLLKIHASEVHI